MAGVDEAAKEAYEGLSRFANAYRLNGKQIAEQMLHDHPLLQAYVTGILLDMIDGMAENPNVRPQNENAVKLCQQIRGAIGAYPKYL